MKKYLKGYALKLNKGLKEWFTEKGNGKAVYTIFLAHYIAYECSWLFNVRPNSL
ncbi:hypothetical protein ACQKOF_06395 [Lysinibacillus sp. NPDC093190]|uniref:hypothetical protein n=1 Tax=Lysinibacillus sp. NPDC093190 TaxID=3390575 RepID=UPI003CFD29CF